MGRNVGMTYGACGILIFRLLFLAGVYQSSSSILSALCFTSFRIEIALLGGDFGCPVDEVRHCGMRLLAEMI
jgi:hypothetical protein